MPSNIEIKAVARDFATMLAIAAQLSDSAGERIEQEDVFFRVARGRLKLRILAADRGELIYYERDDAAGPKQSRYSIAPVDGPANLRGVLEAAIGIRGVVRKVRRLYLVGQTRIHLDEVEGLGRFVELEVVLRPGQSPDGGRDIAEDLMKRLGIEPGDLIEGAYVDLLEAAE